MDRNTVVFQIDLTCERNPNAPKGSTKPSELYINHELLSSHLTWVPAGEQEEVFVGKTPGPTNPNIVLAKLRPHQHVNMELHAVKGVGKDHAKFCPVGTFFVFFLHSPSFYHSIYSLFFLFCWFKQRLRIVYYPTSRSQNQYHSTSLKSFKNVFLQESSKSILELKKSVWMKKTCGRILWAEKYCDIQNSQTQLSWVVCEIISYVMSHPPHSFSYVSSVALTGAYIIVSVESEGPYAPERLLPEAIKVMREKLAIITEAAVALREKYSTIDNDISMTNAWFFYPYFFQLYFAKIDSHFFVIPPSTFCVFFLFHSPSGLCGILEPFVIATRCRWPCVPSRSGWE